MKKKTVFLSAAIHSAGLRRLNGRIKRLIEKEDFEAILPQERRPVTKNFSDTEIYKSNLEDVRSANIIVVVFDKAGNGVIFETGTAYAEAKIIIGVLFKKSHLSSDRMIKDFWEKLKFKARSLNELRGILRSIKNGTKIFEKEVKEMPKFKKCKKCKDGVIETGNNDLPCDCPAGAKALFNVAGIDGPITGEEMRRHFLNNSPEPIEIGRENIPASSLPGRKK